MNNDRFRFRAWDERRNRMICNPFIDIFQDGSMSIMEKYGISDSDDKFILMQCTGLKDSEGKLIYEGDIVDTRGECGTVHVVEWMNIDHGVGLSIDCSGTLGLQAAKVIGNIYMNPELLEKK